MTSHRVPELRFGRRTVTAGGNAQNAGGKTTGRKTVYDLAKYRYVEVSKHDTRRAAKQRSEQ